MSMCSLPVIAPDELEAQAIELLPDRDTMFLPTINVTNVIGVNLSLAINAATINSQATAFADQALGILGP
jgi:hypothetical protein